MAEEMSPDEMAQRNLLINELVDSAFRQTNEYLSAPQLTCGQYELNEVVDIWEDDWLAVGKIKPSELETFDFFSNFKKRFAKEIKEYEELKKRVGTSDPDKLRVAYLDENKYPANDLARHFNPFWKLPDEPDDEE